MNYYAAPMEGLTDRVWRQAHQKWFGPAGNADRYYAPFISPPENRVLIKKKMAELAPAANPGAPVIPQLLAKDGELAAWMISELRNLGYTVEEALAEVDRFLDHAMLSNQNTVYSSSGFSLNGRWRNRLSKRKAFFFLSNSAVYL